MPLIAGEPKAIDDKGFLISFDETHKFHYDQISKPENRSIVEKLFFEVIGWKINVSCTLEGQNNDGTNPKENSALNKALEFLGKYSRNKRIIRRYVYNGFWWSKYE